MITKSPEELGQIQPGDGIPACAFCGTTENVIKGYYAHVGGYGDDQWIPSHCREDIACMKRQIARNHPE